MKEETYGIIDIGSNTIRLVIYKYETIGRFREVENIKIVARLRNFLDEHMVLKEEGVNLLINTLVHFEEITSHHQVNHVIGIATATVRCAQNQNEILERVRAKTNVKIRVLSGYEEAYYGFLAVVNSTSITEGITIDIGGGSTEITYFKDREIKHYYSFPFGALSLKSERIAGDVPTEEELCALTDYLFEQIQSLDWLKNRKVPIIGIGGSARNMVQIDQALKEYPIAGLHQYEMNIDSIEGVFDHLMCLPFEELKKVEGLSEDRADIILPAVKVFQVLCTIVQPPSFLLSRKGLRDGVFYQLLMQSNEITKFPNVLEESFYEMVNEYKIDMNNVVQVLKISREIFMQSERCAGLSTEDYIDLKRSVPMFYLGGFIDSEASSQHTFYVLANRTIDGLTHKERIKLALIASYKSKSYFKQYIDPFKSWFTKEEAKRIRFLGGIVKLSHALNYTKRNVVEKINITTDKAGLLFEVYFNQNGHAEQYQVEKQKKHLEKLLKEEVTFVFKQIPS